MRSISIPAQERQALRERYASVGSPYTQPQSSLIALHRAFASLPDALLGELFRFGRDPGSPGVLLIDGLPIDEALPPTPTTGTVPTERATLDAEKSLLGLAHQIGTPVGYRTEKDGQLVHHVVPMAGGEYTQSNRGSKVMLTFHNDSMYDTSLIFNSHNPDFILLLCLRADAQGAAETMYVDARDLHTRLDDATLAVLYEARFRMAAPSNYTLLIHGALADEKVWSQPVPVLSGPRAYPEIYLAANGVQPLDPQASAALSELIAACEETGRSNAVRLVPGQAMLINNRKGVHARTPFQAHYDGHDRWLLRANIRTSLWNIRDFATEQALVFA